MDLRPVDQIELVEIRSAENITTPIIIQRHNDAINQAFTGEIRIYSLWVQKSLLIAEWIIVLRLPFIRYLRSKEYTPTDLDKRMTDDLLTSTTVS